jgi:hypothetical protein
MMVFGVVVALTPFVVGAQSRDVTRVLIDGLERRLTDVEGANSETRLALIEQRMGAVEQLIGEQGTVQKVSASGIGALLFGAGIVVLRQRKVRIDISAQPSE